MNIHRIVTKTKSEGPGSRVAIWVQGCSIHCNDCMAKETWSTSPKQLLEVEELLSIIDSALDIEGITVLGGEPFDQVCELARLTDGIKSRDLSIIIFTGHTYEDLMSINDPDIAKVLNNTDVLIDGPYVEEERSFERPLVGSNNQRFLFLSDRYNLSDFKNNAIEIRISQDGIVQYNGMGDFRKLRERQVCEHEF